MSVHARLYMLDALRGCALLSMVAYHAVYDLCYIFGMHWKWFESPGTEIWRISIAVAFLCIAGMSAHLSKNNYMRAGKLALISCAITLVTYVVQIDTPIWFGIIHCICVCTLICALIDSACRVHHNAVLLCICIVLCIVTWHIKDGYLWVGTRIDLADWMYTSDVFAWLGFPTRHFSSGDYYPILPYIFVYMAGYALMGLLEHKASAQACLARKAPAPLVKLGQHSLLIYLTHQFVLLAIIWCYFKITQLLG